MKFSLLSLFAVLTMIAFSITVIGPFVQPAQADSYTHIVYHYRLSGNCPGCGSPQYEYLGSSSGIMSHTGHITHSDPESSECYNHSSQQ